MEMVSDPPFGIERVFGRLRDVKPLTETQEKPDSLDGFFNPNEQSRYKGRVVNYWLRDGQDYGFTEKIKHLICIFGTMIDEWYYGRMLKKE